MATKKPKITDKMQEVAADILTQFMFTNTMEDVMKVWHAVYGQYELCDDPFTLTPCSLKKCCRNSLEYDRQIMIERYGHCDGLD